MKLMPSMDLCAYCSVVPLNKPSTKAPPSYEILGSIQYKLDKPPETEGEILIYIYIYIYILNSN